MGRDMAQKVSVWRLFWEMVFRSQVIPCWICGGQSGIGTGFPPSTLVFPLHKNSTNAPYPYCIHLPPTLRTLSIKQRR